MEDDVYRSDVSTNIMKHLKTLNLALQERDKIISDLAEDGCNTT
jgi:hypothetical protein